MLENLSLLVLVQLPGSLVEKSGSSDFDVMKASERDDKVEAEENLDKRFKANMVSMTLDRTMHDIPQAMSSSSLRVK